MSVRLTSRLGRVARTALPAAPRRIVRALRHHSARARALAERAQQPLRFTGIRSWLQALVAIMSAHAAARRGALRLLLQKPSSLRELAARRAAPRRRVNRPRRLAASTAGWFGFGFGTR